MKRIAKIRGVEGERLGNKNVLVQIEENISATLVRNYEEFLTFKLLNPGKIFHHIRREEGE